MCLLHDWCNICSCQQLLKDLINAQRFQSKEYALTILTPLPPMASASTMPVRSAPQAAWKLRKVKFPSMTSNANAQHVEVSANASSLGVDVWHIQHKKNWNYLEHLRTVREAHIATIHPYLHILPSRFQCEIPPAVIYSLKLQVDPSHQWHASIKNTNLFEKIAKTPTTWATTGASTNDSSFDPCFEPGLPASSLEPLFDPGVSLDPLFPTSSLDPLFTKPSSLDPLLAKPSSLDPLLATSSLDPLLVRPGSSFDPFF